MQYLYKFQILEYIFSSPEHKVNELFNTLNILKFSSVINFFYTFWLLFLVFYLVLVFRKLQSTADRLENTEARLRMAESDMNTDLESVLIKLEEEQQR